MERVRSLKVSRRSLLVLGVLQVGCAGLCLVCAVMDAAFRKKTALSGSRTPLWGGLVMACPGVLALFVYWRKNTLLVCAMAGAAVLSCLTSVLVSGYAVLTLTYGEENQDVFHHHKSPDVTMVLHRSVKASNATILLCCCISLILCALIGYFACRSLPVCICYDNHTGLELLLPQSDPGDSEMVCTWSAGGGEHRVFNAPLPPTEQDTTEEEEDTPPHLTPYSPPT